MVPRSSPLHARRPSRDRRPTGHHERLSRRRLLGGAVAGAGLTAQSGGGSRAWSAARQVATPTAFVPGAALVPPRELQSANGRLDVALEANFGPARVGGRTVTTYSYDGEIPGPTLRLRPGDTLGISLTNRLDEATNLHTHGLHVSPMGNSDNVFLQLLRARRRDGGS